MYYYIQLGMNSWGIYISTQEDINKLESIGLLSSEDLAKEYVQFKNAVTKAN